MANVPYPTAKKAFLDGEIDLLDDDIKVVLLDSGYTYDEADEFLDDIAGAAIVDTSGNLASKTTTAGAFDADDVTFASLTGDDVESYVVYQDTGSDATSRLIAYVDERSDTSPLSFTPDGTDFTLRWPTAGILSF